MSRVDAMYDALAWYVQVENWRTRRSRFADFTLHKALRVDCEADPYAATSYVNKLLVRHAGLGPSPSVLDAGCGFGGTIFHLHAHLGGTYDGITMSRPQLRAARLQARRRGVAHACRFHRRSYDEPVTGHYDAVVTVESLLHARDLRHTIANLAAAVRPGGRMLLVEDMATGDVDATHPHEAHLLREHWGSHRFPRVEDYEACLAAAGFEITRRVDLTAHVCHRPATELDRVGAAYASWHRRVPLAPVRRVLSAYMGGIALEKLYAAGLARYELLVATKPASPCATAEGAPCQDYSARTIPR